MNKPDYDKNKVYKKNDYWFIEAVKYVVVVHGFNFKKLDLAKTTLNTQLKSGMYLIDGVMNQDWQQPCTLGVVDCFVRENY